MAGIIFLNNEEEYKPHKWKKIEKKTYKCKACGFEIEFAGEMINKDRLKNIFSSGSMSCKPKNEN